VAFRDLRETIDALRAGGHLREVTEPVSARYEVAAVLAAAHRAGEGAVLFTRVHDDRGAHDVPVLGNVVHSRAVLAAAMGVSLEELVERFTERVTVPLDPVVVDDAPVQEVTAENVDLAALMPILTHYEEDAGPYLSTGMASVRNPGTGGVERTICRMQLRGRDRLGLALVNPPLVDTWRLYGRDREMPVAVAVGLEPVTFVSAALPAPPGEEKMAYAGGLRAEAVELTSAGVTGLPVPARAEFLLEGVLVPGAEQDDGPFGEISGYSMVFSSTPTFHVQRVSHRRAPLYHALLPTGPDGDLITGLTVEAAIVPQLRRMFSFARSVTFVPSTFGMSLVVQVAPADKGRVRGLLYHLLSLERIKKVVLVAEDIDPDDPHEVEWAVVTRAQPDEDLVVIDGVFAHPIDPSYHPGQRTSRVGIDATGFERIGGRTKARIAATAAAKATGILNARGGGA
jgi:2,5-furandicarboxylate decarboxylase 1